MNYECVDCGISWDREDLARSCCSVLPTGLIDLDFDEIEAEEIDLEKYLGELK